MKNGLDTRAYNLLCNELPGFSETPYWGQRELVREFIHTKGGAPFFLKMRNFGRKSWADLCKWCGYQDEHAPDHVKRCILYLIEHGYAVYKVVE